jgi:glycosyltransferase involved in cell wall biosynthesis
MFLRKSIHRYFKLNTRLQELQKTKAIIKMIATERAISIIIPVRNEGKRVLKTIETFVLGRSSLFPLEFVIVDDASEDGCCTGLENRFSRTEAIQIRVIRLKRWSGIPYARNKGAEVAQTPILFITDANVEAGVGWDIPIFRDIQHGRALCATIANMSSSWRGYGCWLDATSMGINCWLPDAYTFGGYIPVSPSAGTILHTELFRQLGGYDTAMPTYGAAEPEFSVRLWLYGGEIISCPDLILKHRFRPPSERKPFLDHIRFIQTVNYLRFGLLYLDERGIVRLLDYWARAAPDHFSNALQQVERTRVWERRRHLRENLPRDFAWYARSFGI